MWKREKSVLPRDGLSALQKATSYCLLGGPNSETNAAVPNRILQIHFD